MYKRRTILFALFLHAALFAQAQHFQVNATIEGLPEGTMLYIRSSKPDIRLDSARVADGKVAFKGTMPSKITKVYLHDAKFSNYISFWLEEQPVTVSLKAGQFRKGKVTGSKTQMEYDNFSALLTPLEKKEDSLSALLSKGNADKNIVKDQYNAVRNELVQVQMDYIRDNPASLVSAYILDVYASTWGKDKAKPLYDNFTPALKQTDFGKNIANFISLNKNIKIGDQFIDIEQANTTGKKVKLSSSLGKYTLLEFWGSWCGPCRAENPNLVKTYEEYKSKGFAVFGVAADESKEQWLKAVKDDKLPWENVTDLKGDKNTAAIVYGISAYPTNFLIDANGKIIAKNLRGETLRDKLKELLP